MRIIRHRHLALLLRLQRVIVPFLVAIEINLVNINQNPRITLVRRHIPTRRRTPHINHRPRPTPSRRPGRRRPRIRSKPPTTTTSPRSPSRPRPQRPPNTSSTPHRPPTTSSPTGSSTTSTAPSARYSSRLLQSLSIPLGFNLLDRLALFFAAPAYGAGLVF